ncbi:MAG: enoyl-CoA hydratase/isomerase family protein [Acidimicrobiales bacterium]
MTPLLREVPADGVVLLRFNRPERLNALNEVLVGELLQAFGQLSKDRDARVVILTGSGRGFCSGLDVRDFGPAMLEASAPAIDRLRFQEMMASLPQAVRSLPQPVIAAVNGPAVGAGLALALAADIRICSEMATFGNAAILLGLSGAEMGISYLLPRVVGLSAAADWMLTGRTVSAQEANRRGLVSELVDGEHLVGRATELASQVAGHSPLGVQMTKRAIQANVDAPDLLSAIELENRNQVITHATEEAAAARRRWAEGR